MHFHLPKPLHGWREFAGEVGIIVLGVLIALGAEQVVQAVHAQHQEHQRLERLFEESRSNVAQLRAMRDALGRMTRRETAFAVALSHGSCPVEELWDTPVTVNRYPAIVARTSVYDEVVGAGGLASIKSPEARTAVADFHAMLQWVSSQTDFFRANRTYPVRPDDARVTVHYVPQAQDPEALTFDRSALCADHAFRNRMMDSVRDHTTNYVYRSRLTDRALQMCGALARVLGKECTPSSGPPLTKTDRAVAAGTAKTSL